MELADGATPIAGSIAAAGQPPREFVGYIQLIQELERARPERLPPIAAPPTGRV
jgi:hypothetical protein